MVTAHPVVLRGALAAAGGAPLLVERGDQDFVAAILAELTSAEGRRALAASRARERDARGRLRLRQPVHRVMAVALVEAACDVVGQPRLDPASIESAGLVVRRARGGRREGWMRAGPRLRGWLPLASVREGDLDPDPARRPPALRAGHAEIDRRLAAVAPPPLAEAVAPLFVAPPEVCVAAGRTVLYGLVPVTSAEVSEAPPAPAYPMDVVRAHLVPSFLRPSRDGRPLPRAGRTLTAADGEAADLAPFVTMLRQLAVECDAFGDGEAGRPLRALLDRVALPFGDERRPAGPLLARASEVLLGRAAGDVRLPDGWPPVGEPLAEAIAAAVKAAMEARLRAIVPRRGRFEEPAAVYHARAFVRVRRPDDCPPALVWSAESEPFAIAPWYEAGGPPVEVTLPEPAALRRLQPNVTFRVPEPLLNVLAANKPSDFLEGRAREGGPGIGLGWVCSFSIPIITLCAFIVLNVFLSLFDVVFRWLLFIKVCLPVPAPSSGDEA
jgi:hypothetical protein